MAIKKIFKSHLRGGTYITRKGKVLAFVEGKYITDNEEEVQELMAEIKTGHPYFYIDPNETEIDTTLEEKIREAKAAAVGSVLAEYYKSNPQANSVLDEAEAVAAGAISAAALTKVATAASLQTPAQVLGVATTATLGALSAASNTK